ncbi:uncharacterized protein si:ch211-180a12.2 isoform X2 [Etheostoma spectabile]|uniref:uncharacterized protein si:ch211-180a12.2 isoform X2 n=1 Tax=Etheostoma spectabile TaxID=54343 RepID=UPI0013AF847D|nr:uncharacterized protein LOC116671266 isoform X2 [Etheostoma spectabile]
MQCKVLVYVVLLTLIKHVSPSEIQASPNTNATLPCNVTFPLSAKGDKMDKSLIKASWINNGSDIASFREAATQIKEGFSWDTTGFINGDFSLTVLRAGLDLQGQYECTISYNSTMLHSSNVTLRILASPTLSIPQQWVVLETESHFTCHADGFHPPPVSFSWTRDGQMIQPPYHIEGEQTPDGYYKAVGNLTFYPSREDQNVTFGCKVSHNGSYQELDFQLNITYLPSVTLSAVLSHSNNIPLTLYCDVESFYPEEISVSWLQNSTVLPEPPATELNPDGTYRTRHYYTLSPEQREQGGKVECAVNQPGVVHPVSGSAYLEKLDPQAEAPVLTKSAKASVALMCISLVLVVLLCFGVSWRRRDEKKKSLNVSGIILPPRVIVGQKGRVTMSIEGRRVDRVQTAWFLNDTPISDTSLTGTSKTNFNCLYNPLTTIHLPYGLTLTSPASEKGPLLPSKGEMGYYKLHTLGPLYSSGSGTQQLISSLTFIPQISIHKGAVLKCQVSYMGKDKIVVERVSEKFTILSAPEVSEIQLAETPGDSDVISMTVQASHFHPDIITFRWFCQGSELSPVASQASSSPRPNSEGVFSAFSQCKLPRSELEKEGTKVWVSVHHIALKQPVTRETRGFIKSPCVSEIIGSTSSPEKTLILGCEITDFYPPNVSVTWLKLRGGEQDDREEEVIVGGEMWGPIQTQSRLYRATATLRRRPTNQEKKERGGGIICRVEHCSLLEPIEKHWRNVDVGGRGVDEEQPLATSSLLSSSRPLVAGEVCTTEINLRPDEESVQYTIQPNRIGESKATEEGQGTREEQFAQARNDDDGLLVAKEDKQEDKQEDNGDHKLSRQDETPENEHTNTRSQRLTGDAMCEDMEESGRNAGAEEVSMTVHDHQKMDETIPVKEEDDEMQHDHKPDLGAEDIEVELCTIKDLSIKEEDDMHIEEAKLQRNEADTTVTHEEVEYIDSVQQLGSQNEKKSEAAKQVENQLSLCKELSDDGRDFRGDPGFTSLHVELQTTYDKSGIVSEEEVIVVKQEHLMEDEGAVIEEENSNDAATNQTKDEAPEQEGDIRTVTEDRQEEQNVIEHEVTQNAKTEPHTAEFADGEQEDVAKDGKVQTTTREADVETESCGTVIEENSDVTAAHISIEERLSSEVRNKENIMELGCMTTSATNKTEGEAGQEMTEKLKNLPLGLCEGRVAVSPELNSPTCEETQEGVPEYNNEPSPGDNATQRFLEEGDCEEIQGSQLPEEVESKEPESLQNSAFSTGDYLLVREHMEEKQESPRDIKCSFETGLPQESEKPLVEVVIQEYGHLLVEEEGELLVDLMKTGIEHSRFESDVGLPDEGVKAQDGPEGLLVEFEIDKELHDSNIDDAAGEGSEVPGDVTAEEEVGFADETFLEVKEQKMTVTRFFQELVDAIDSEQNSNMTPSSLEDITKSELLKQLAETEPELREDVEMQDAGIHMEEDAAEDEKQNKNEMEFLHLQVAGMADSESYRLVESLQTEIQLSDKACEISNEEVLTEAAGESKTVESKLKGFTSSTEDVAKHVTESEGSCAEETICSISGHQDVIDEEILDLWLQTALSEDAGGIKHQEGPEPRHQMEPSNQEPDEISSVQTEKDKEQLFELNSKESELVSDTEMSSSTVESGFLDQSLSEWGIHNTETQLLKTSSTVSFPGLHNMLANMSESANIPELSPQDFNSGSLDKVMEKVAETAQSYLKEEDSIHERGFHPDTAVAPPEARHLNQESQEKTEEVETQTGSQKEVDAEVTDWTDTKEAEFKPMTEMSMRMFRVEKPKAEDEPLEITLSDSLDQIKHTESGRPRSSSESLFEEVIVLTDSGLQGDTWTESKRKLPSLDKAQPGWSADIAESFPGLNRMEVAEQPTTESKDLMEVDTAALDFAAQKSRISVKNPRVRPPKDPRSLLHKPSVDPTPSSHLSAKVLPGVPLRGLGIGIKLPGLGAGFPVLKKTQQVVSNEYSPETLSQETKPEEKSDSPKQDEAQPKPKWMTPRHPGFGNPLMSELKTKLKKTTKE